MNDGSKAAEKVVQAVVEKINKNSAQYIEHKEMEELEKEEQAKEFERRLSLGFLMTTLR